MTNVRRLAISATAVLLLVATAGCADDGSDPPSSTPTTSSPSSTAPSTPSASATLGESERAGQRAEALMRKYFEVLDELRQQPGKPLRLLSTVATSTQLSAQRKLVDRERSEGLRQVGQIEIADLSVQAVNFDNSNPDEGRVPTVTVDVCWDVGHADLIDGAGQSVVDPSRPPTGWTRYTVANYEWSKNPSGGWRVASSQDLKKMPCAAS